MAEYRQHRVTTTGGSIRWAALVIMCVSLVAVHAQVNEKNPGAQSITLDRVVAVVNRQTILASDVEQEMQVSILDPSRIQTQKETAGQALDRLISRMLIEQQIQQENVPTAPPTQAEIAARVQEIRTELPACIRADCQSNTGWDAFLASHDLLPARVESYLRNRAEILSFIELRFRQGIRITPDEIEAYYRGTLLPEYPTGQSAPPLQQVSARIEEILLQQRVTELFSSWLANLRSQGQIEVLDPALETTHAAASEESTKE